MANIKKMDTRQRMLSIQDELNHILADFLEPQQERYLARSRNLEIQVDVYETEDAINILAELPGMAIDDIGLFLSRDLLVIEGTKHASPTSENGHYLNLEREYGTYKRDVGIPKPINADKISARLDNGILHVVLPKISDRRGKRKRIPID